MLTDKDIERVAALARIKISDSEKQSLKKDLSSILDYIDKLNMLDTNNVEPLYQTSGLTNSTRADELRNEYPPSKKLDELLINQAPHKKDRFIKVPSVLNKK